MPRVVVVAAAVIAVVAIFMAAMAGYYSRDSRETTSGVRVVVATTDIPFGTEISEEMVEVIDVPNDDVLAGAYSDTMPVVGQWPRIALVKGEQVVPAKLIITDSPLPPGMLPVLLAINPVTTEGEPIFAGDRIDVLIERDGAASATTVVENVEVLAVGRTVSLTPSQQTITVAGEPEQAQLLWETLGDSLTVIRLRRLG